MRESLGRGHVLEKGGPEDRGPNHGPAGPPGRRGPTGGRCGSPLQSPRLWQAPDSTSTECASPSWLLLSGLCPPPPNRMFRSSSPAFRNVTLFGDRVLTAVELKWGHWEEPSCNVTGVLTERGNLDTDVHTGRSHVTKQPRGGDALTSRGVTKTPANHQRPGEGRGTGSPLEPAKQPGLPTPRSRTSSLGFLRFLWAEPPRLWGVAAAALTG